MSLAHGISPYRALYNVLVAPSIRKSLPACRTAITLTRHRGHVSTQAHRAFTTSPTSLAKVRPPEKRTQLWNKEIPARMIRLQLTTEEDKKPRLDEPRTLRDVLFSFDDKTHRLVCITTPPPKEELDPRTWMPICKIVSKKEEYEREKARDKQKKDAKKLTTSATKILELNWAIDVNNDLNHRRNQIKKFLEEGKRVEVVLAKKKRGREASPDECEAVVKSIRATMSEVTGAKEMKPMEGNLGGLATLYLEGPRG